MTALRRGLDLLVAARIPTALFSLPLPIAGYLVARPAERPDLAVLLPALGSILLLFAHVLLWNNAADVERDRLGPPRDFIAPSARLGRTTLLAAGAVALAAALLLAIVVGLPLVLGEAAVAVLWFLYACPPLLAKGRPFAGPVVHVAAGAAHVLLGAFAAGSLPGTVVALAAWFGFATSAGYLTHLVLDVASDRGSGMRTAAVVLGERATLVASSAMFAAAGGMVPFFVLAGGSRRSAALLAASSLAAAVAGGLVLRKGRSVDRAALLFRRIYRALFVVGGLLFLASELVARD